MSPGLTSSTVVANPAGDVDKPYRVSLWYCRWDGQQSRYSSCAPDIHSYEGTANFQVSSAAVYDSRLANTTPYFKQPICTIAFENIVVLYRIDTDKTLIHIYILYYTWTGRKRQELDNCVYLDVHHLPWSNGSMTFC